MAPAPVSDVLCSPWATYDDVPQVTRDEFDLTEPEWVILLRKASEILWALSGRVWYGGGCEETAVLRSDPPGSGTWPYERSWGRCSCWQMWPHGGAPAGYRHIAGPIAVKLPRSPITEVTAVTVGGDAFTDWRLIRAGWIERTDGQPWAVCSGDTEITYLFGEPPPLGGKDAAVQLAIQFARARTGVGDCQLPTNVVSVTRQGVTIERLSVNDFLDKGRVGLPDVDLWLAAVNPTGHQSAAFVWSPDLPHTIRTA